MPEQKGNEKDKVRLRIIFKRPRYELKPLAPGKAADRIALIRYAFMQKNDYVFALLASYINVKEWVSVDGKEPKELCVLKVSEDESNFDLGINFKLFNKLSFKAQQELIKIQILKILHGHLTKRTKSIFEKYGPEIFKVASLITLAQFVNPSILAEEGIILPVPEMWEYPRNLTIEQYAQKLYNDGQGGLPALSPNFALDQDGTSVNIKQIIQNMSEEFKNLLNSLGFSNVDNLSFDGNVLEGEVDKEVLDQLTNQLINNVQNTLKEIYDVDLKSQGFIAGDALQIIKALNRRPKIKWHHILHNVHARYAGKHKKISKVRPSRRTTTFIKADGTKFNPYMGRVHNPEVLALWIIDTSGSMSSKELRCVDSEIRGMKARGCRILVMQVDAGVAQPPVEYTGAEKLEKWFGRGGTSFEPGLEYAAEMIPIPDYVVYFTDGYGTAPKKPIPIPVLWVLTSTGMSINEFRRTVCAWGEVTKIDVESED